MNEMQKKAKTRAFGGETACTTGEGLIITNLVDYICCLGPCPDFRVGNWSEPYSNKSLLTFQWLQFIRGCSSLQEVRTPGDALLARNGVIALTSRSKS
jgi:hypothetical protein